MLQSVNELKGYDIIASNGKIGSIKEFYFNDQDLKVRYLVADTGKWLIGRQQLIPPVAITHLDRANRNIHISLNAEQVKNSPDIDQHKPVSRQMEELISGYYSDPRYWDKRPNLTSDQLASANATASIIEASIDTNSAAAPAPDVYLRSMAEITSYRLEAKDGEIGKVEDFFVETDDWSIRYIGVKTGGWLPGKDVLISALWLEKFNWAERKVGVNLSREQIENSPDYEKVTEISHEYETRLRKHYER